MSKAAADRQRLEAELRGRRVEAVGPSRRPKVRVQDVREDVPRPARAAIRLVARAAACWSRRYGNRSIEQDGSDCPRHPHDAGSAGREPNTPPTDLPHRTGQQYAAPSVERTTGTRARRGG